MDILDDMGVSNLSAKVFFKVNYSFIFLIHQSGSCVAVYGGTEITPISSKDLHLYS